VSIACSQYRDWASEVMEIVEGEVIVGVPLGDQWVSMVGNGHKSIVDHHGHVEHIPPVALG
jgi:hypothetical protein